MLGLKCHLITDLLLETNEAPHIPHKLQYFPNEETKSQRGEEKFLCHSEQLTESGWEGTPNGQTPGRLYLLQTFSSSSFLEGLWAS